jgi:hypothetical protein
MKPSNDHEQEIARIVDRMNVSDNGKVDLLAIPDIIRAISFSMTRDDSHFLIRYINWTRSPSDGAE